ncbi:HET-domain-containing protein [Xylariomycetidae sp. FL0641]|nr:HET-domain-containing protein [Xylariomycetidae sp. FL0641]
MAGTDSDFGFDLEEAETSTHDSLGDLIIRSSADSNFDGPRNLQRLIDWVYHDAQKLFACLCFCGFEPQHTVLMLAKFHKERISDHNLPFSKWSSNLSAQKPPELRLKVWTEFRLDRFYSNQWRFLVPVFSPDQYEYDLEPECILPFTKDDETETEGAFGRVYKVTTHEQHTRHPVNEAVVQLHGLFGALFRLHNLNLNDPPPGSESQAASDPDGGVDIPVVRLEGPGHNGVERNGKAQSGSSTDYMRHGDLKPENILSFSSSKNRHSDRAGIGDLRIADMGLAKRHFIATQDRKCGTSTRHGTALYEAPKNHLLKGLSRVYDIWGMGCITFEFILWLLYGYNQIESLYDQMETRTNQTFQYFETTWGEGGQEYRVHDVVQKWMDYMQQNDPECKAGSAIGDLLHLVRTRLLVIAEPPNNSGSLERRFSSGLDLSSPGVEEDRRPCRATAKECLDALEKIKSRLDAAGYAATGRPRDHADYALPPLDGWGFPVDNAFAEKVYAELDHDALLPSSPKEASLCDQCRSLDFWRGGFSFHYLVSDMNSRKNQCELCKMLVDAHERCGPEGAQQVGFERVESVLNISGGSSLPVISILRSPELPTPLPVQVGLPKLLSPGSKDFFHLCRLWLRDCDEDHRDCQLALIKPLPSRLIEIKHGPVPDLRLIETRETPPTDQRYVALSHPWGDTKKYPAFSTRRKDPSGRGHELEAFKQSIPFEQLPATFKDAVTATEALGIRYLWIDSICILQGDDGDFSDEAKRMEDVFSCAYCVLAASRASNQHDGFLQERRSREYLTLKGANGRPFYLCESIDDFSRDVLQGDLSRRGWVLQERALARRTIFFTKTQTYFECGNGVRCETLAKMHNNMADFLGDPRFPDKAMKVQRGLKIRYFQDLYRQYSRLQFTHIEDKPFAIEGLENRLRKAYSTEGGFGIFDDGPGKGLFHRSLLWQRGADETLKSFEQISFPPTRNVFIPSWSWMRYRGGIDYIDPPFDKTDWEVEDIQPPWTGRRAEMNWDSGPLHHNYQYELKATARGYNVARSRSDEVRLVYDVERTMSDSKEVQCVIVAKSKDGKAPNGKMYYVLIVGPTMSPSTSGVKIYRRLGAGFMKGEYIRFDDAGIEVRIR